MQLMIVMARNKKLAINQMIHLWDSRSFTNHKQWNWIRVKSLEKRLAITNKVIKLKQTVTANNLAGKSLKKLKRNMTRKYYKETVIL